MKATVYHTIHLGPLVWDPDESSFRDPERWDMDGAHITTERLPAQFTQATDHAENIHGWQVSITATIAYSDVPEALAEDIERASCEIAI